MTLNLAPPEFGRAALDPFPFPLLAGVISTVGRYLAAMIFITKRVSDCAAATNMLSNLMDGAWDEVPMRSRKVRIAIRGRRAPLAPTPTIGQATKVHQALDPKPARQSTVDRRFDKGGAKEGERDRSTDPTFSFALARGQQFDG